MSSRTFPNPDAKPPPFGFVNLVRLAVIGLVLAALAGGFAYTAGWFSPQRLTGGRLVDDFEKVNGIYPGFRRNHAKGVCVSGTFTGSGRAAKLSDAVVFASMQVPVIGRFSLFGGKPFVADTPHVVLAMALSFHPAGAEEWRTGMVDLPVFPADTAQHFADYLFATKPDPLTGKPNPVIMGTFLSSHAETRRAFKLIAARSLPSGFADATYNGLNAFIFLNSRHIATPVRWSMVPTTPFVAASTTTLPKDRNYLFDDLVARLHAGPLQWHLMISLGQPSDPTNDATIPWPTTRTMVDAGILTIDHLQDEADGPCRQMNFDPLVLPNGILPSDDPLLDARSSAYAQSFTRRVTEHPEPSAVVVSAFASPTSDRGN